MRLIGSSFCEKEKIVVNEWWWRSACRVRSGALRLIVSGDYLSSTVVQTDTLCSFLKNGAVLFD
jgi:hypothetical protein